MGNITSNMSTINSEHDCRNDECKGDKFKGVKFNCNQCDKIWRLECVIGQDGIYDLAELIGLIRYDEEKRTNIASVNEQKKQQLNKIIGKDSPIEYACETCREKGRTRDRIKQMEEEIEKWKENATEINEKYNEIEKKNNELKETIRENQKVIQQMTDAADRPERWSERDIRSELVQIIDENSGDDANGNENRNEYENIMKRVINSTIPNILKREMDKITKTINDKVTKECKKVSETVIVQIEKNKSMQHVNKNVTFSNDICNTSHEQTEAEHNNNIQFDTNLKPAKQTKDTYKESKVHEMYVSKFACDVTKEIVEQHILNNTDISKEAFKIEEMRSTNNERERNYKAYKITTLTHKNYEEIMQIWEPNFVAREFRPSMYEKGQTKPNTFQNSRNEIFKRTPNETYRMRASERERQYTPRKNTPMNNKYDRYATPERYNYNYSGERGERERHDSDRFGRQNRKQQQQFTNEHEDQHTNTRTNFLDRNRKAQQGVNRQHQQGVNNPFRRHR